MDKKNIWETHKFQKLDEKCLRVITSCNTIEQLKGAFKYVSLIEKYLKDDIHTKEDKLFVSNFIAHRKGFIQGLVFQMMGRGDIILENQ